MAPIMREKNKLGDRKRNRNGMEIRGGMERSKLPCVRKMEGGGG